MKTVHLLSSVDPNLLSTAKATMLLPFLKSAATPEEQVISDYLLRIFRAAVVAMPKTSTKFGRDLQGALVPMLNKPSQSVGVRASLLQIPTSPSVLTASREPDAARGRRVFLRRHPRPNAGLYDHGPRL